MPINNEIGAGRPPKIAVPFALAKTLWDRVWKKFISDHADKIGNLTLTAKLEMLAQKANVGAAPVKELKKDVAQAPAPDIVLMSHSAVNGLCDYLPDEDLKRNILASIEDPDVMWLARYFGRYRLYWREKRGGVWEHPHYTLKFGAAGTELIDELGEVSSGKRIVLKKLNLFCSVENEHKFNQFIFNVGEAVGNNLDLIPGLCQTTTPASIPAMAAVLLVHEGAAEEKYSEQNLNRFFDQYRGRSLLKAVQIDWFNNPPPYRIGGLFGNWYIYRANNGIIRRGKIRIASQYNLYYQGTRHRFDKGKIEVFGSNCVTLDFANDYKHLHLIGRIGDAELKNRNHIPCIFASTGNEGRTLKSGVSLMLREPDIPYEAMTTGIFTPDNYPPDLPPEHLKFLLDNQGSIEV